MSNSLPFDDAREFSDLWDALVRDEAPWSTDFAASPATEFISRFHTAARSRIPAGAQAQQRAEVLAVARAQFNGKGSHVDVMFDSTTRPVASLRPTLFPGSRNRKIALPFPSGVRVRTSAMAISMAALLILIAAMSIVIFSNDGTPAHLPSVVATPISIDSGTGNWPTFLQNNQRNGVVAESGPLGDLVPAWTYQGTIQSNDLAILDGKLVAVYDDGTFVVFDAATGEKLLTQGFAEATGDAAIFRSAVTLSADSGSLVAFASTYKGTILAIDVATGGELWRYSTPGTIYMPPAVENGTLYVGNRSGMVIALDVTTGKERWTATIDGSDFSKSSVSLADGIAITSDIAGTTFAFDDATGKQLWTHPSNAGYGGISPIVDGVIYSPNGNELSALDLKTGAERWKYTAGEGQTVIIPTVANGKVLFDIANDRTVVLDAATGALVREVEGILPGWAFITVGDGIAYLGTGNGGIVGFDVETYAVVARGSGAFTDAPFIIANGMLYTANDLGEIVAWTSSGPLSAEVNASTAGAPVPSFAWAASGEGENAIADAGTVTLAPDGSSWVTQADGKIRVFEADGAYRETWGTFGADEGEFAFGSQSGTVGAIAFAADGSFFISDIGNSQVHHFAADRTLIADWGVRGSQDGQLWMPSGIAIDGDGNVLVADMTRNNIQKFTPDGEFISFLVKPGFSTISLNTPGLMDIDSTGRVWIADAGNDRIVAINPDGTEAFEFGSHGSGNGTFDVPFDVKLDEQGRAYVADQSNCVIQVFDATGTFLYQFGGFGNGDGQFYTPDSISITGDEIMVLDYDNNRIQKFTITDN